MTKDAFWFSHDSNARYDKKILAMRSGYGFEGYGWYWAIIEMLRDEKDYRLNLSQKYFFQVMAKELDTTPEKAESFVLECIEDFGLFVSDGTEFWSESLIRRMEKKDEIREKRSRAGRKGAKARWEHADDMANTSQTHSNTNAEAMANDSYKKTRQLQQDKTKEKEEKTTTNNGSRSFSLSPSLLLKDLQATYFSQFQNPDKTWSEVLDLIEQYNAEIVMWAMDEAVKKNKTFLGYVKGILQNKQESREPEKPKKRDGPNWPPEELEKLRRWEENRNMQESMDETASDITNIVSSIGKSIP